MDRAKSYRLLAQQLRASKAHQQFFVDLVDVDPNMRQTRKFLLDRFPWLEDDCIRTILHLLRYLHYDRIVGQMDALEAAQRRLQPVSNDGAKQRRPPMSAEKRHNLLTVIKFRGALLEFTIRRRPTEVESFWAFSRSLGWVIDQSTHQLRRSINAEAAVMLAADHYHLRPQPSSKAEDLYFAIDIWALDKQIAIQVASAQGPTFLNSYDEEMRIPEGIDPSRAAELRDKFGKFRSRVMASQLTSGNPQFAFMILAGNEDFDPNHGQFGEPLKHTMKAIRDRIRAGGLLTSV